MMHRVGYIDDKGMILVSAFGIPPQVHENDPERALEAALVLRPSLRDLGLTSGISIATGRVYCGLVGNAVQREYTILGEVVILAARLMSASSREILY